MQERAGRSANEGRPESGWAASWPRSGVLSRLEPACEPATLVSWALGILQTLEGSGLPREQMLQQAGIAGQVLDDPQARLSLQDIGGLWQLAETHLGPDAGLKVGRNMRLVNWQTLGMGLATSRTPLELLERVTTYVGLVTDSLDIGVQLVDGDGVVLSLDFVTDVSRPELRLDCIVQSALGLIRNLFGFELRPLLRFELIRPQPADPAPWIEAFGPNISWAAPITRVIAPAAVLDLQMPVIDPALSASHLEILQRALQNLDEKKLDGIEQQVRRYLVEVLAGGEPSLQDVATRLAMSGRSLQRKLAEAGTGYREVLDQVRCQLARDYLEQDYDTGEVAYLLGYSEVTNFHAAFKRWTGQTPGQYRKRA